MDGVARGFGVADVSLPVGEHDVLVRLGGFAPFRTTVALSQGAARAVEARLVASDTDDREVLQLVAEGRTIRGISSILSIASRTVVFHKCNLMDKVGLRTTAELTRYAIQCGLLSAPGSLIDYSTAGTAHV